MSREARRQALLDLANDAANAYRKRVTYREKTGDWQFLAQEQQALAIMNEAEALANK